MNFIPGHAIALKNVIDPSILNKIVNLWNFYEVEKNEEMVKYIWKCVESYIPKSCNGKKFVKYDVNRITINKVNKKERCKERGKIQKNTSSLVTLIILLNSDGYIRYFDNKGKNINFSQNAEHYTAKCVSGDALIYTNEIEYEEYRSSYIKIPLFYECLEKKVEKRVQFKKKFEIPTPNGEKFNKVTYMDEYSNVIILTPDFNNSHTVDRWHKVECEDKMIKIDKYKLPPYINTKKGRPPTPKEGYCPNCYEILPLQFPYPFTNCSGCLSPILDILHV